MNLYGRISDRLRRATRRFPAASPDELAQFSETGAGTILAAEWGADARNKLAVALFRWDRLSAPLDDATFDALDDFFRNRLRPEERASVLRTLAT